MRAAAPSPVGTSMRRSRIKHYHVYAPGRPARSTSTNTCSRESRTCCARSPKRWWTCCQVRRTGGNGDGRHPLATVMSQLTGLPTVFVRKHAKEYGTSKVAEGGPAHGRRGVLIEDVATTRGTPNLTEQHLATSFAQGLSDERTSIPLSPQFRRQGNSESSAARPESVTITFNIIRAPDFSTTKPCSTR